MKIFSQKCVHYILSSALCHIPEPELNTKFSEYSYTQGVHFKPVDEAEWGVGGNCDLHVANVQVGQFYKPDDCIVMCNDAPGCKTLNY